VGATDIDDQSPRTSRILGPAVLQPSARSRGADPGRQEAGDPLGTHHEDDRGTARGDGL